MTDDDAAPAQPGLGPWPAAALVFGSSAAVLVVELVALRLLAPYYGLTLETNTMVIGLALTAIAAGTWAGGWTGCCTRRSRSSRRRSTWRRGTCASAGRWWTWTRRRGVRGRSGG